MIEKDKEIERLSAQLLKVNQSLMKIPPGTIALNHMLSIQKSYGDKSSIGYKLLDKHEKESMSTESVHDTDARKDNIQANGSQHRPKSVKESERIIEKIANSERFIAVCHFCSRKGHIRPKCYKLQTYLQAMISQPKSFKRPMQSREWRIKQGGSNSLGLVAHTSLSAFQEGKWHFDSGCSHHMTGNKHILQNLSECKEGIVTFGDGNQGNICGKGELILNGSIPLSYVLYVKGLKANLIIISQLCDNEYTVCFTKTQCTLSSKT